MSKLPARRFPISATGLALLAGCTSTPVASLPDPLPETLDWAWPESANAGAFLGLEVRENDSGSLENLRLDPGVRVARIAPGSPAAEAGFAIGDVLLEWGDVRIDDPETLVAVLADADVAVVHEPLVRRGDSAFRVPVQLRALSTTAGEPTLAWRSDPVRSRAGWLTGRGGVVLVTTDPDGPFEQAGIKVGSVVTELDGEPVRSARTLIRELQAREVGAKVVVRFQGPVDEEGDEDAGTAVVHLWSSPVRLTGAGVPILIGYEASVDGETASFYIVDLWILSLFKYRREGNERHYRLLTFITFSTGVGELAEGGA